jgi:hypothetical protein
MTADEIECIEEGGTEPTVALLRCLAAALDADVCVFLRHGAGVLPAVIAAGFGWPSGRGAAGRGR